MNEVRKVREKIMSLSRNGNLHGGPCERCGDTRFTVRYTVETSQGRRTSVFCGSCGYDPMLESMEKVIPHLSA
ncbi:MAG: hypothetical protein V1851_00860 [Patescibacteria group bacterium]